jgi:hypothetical protein
MEKECARSSLDTHSVDALRPLFRRLAVEVLFVGLGVLPRVVDNAVAMIRRRIQRVELERGAAGVDDIVMCPCRNEYREASVKSCQTPS